MIIKKVNFAMGYKRKKRLVSFETVNEELSPKKQRKERFFFDFVIFY